MADLNEGNGQGHSHFFAVLAKAQSLLLEMEEAVTNGHGCHEILNGFNLIRDVVTELEGELMTLQLERCLAPQLGSNQEIINAVTVLANRKQGALIAIEQPPIANEVLAVSSGGTSLDANLTAMLLEAIFYPGNPLHDGGVIIRDDRIVAAACVFPLSDIKWMEDRKNLGTRHRAALGLSEVTNALVLVVSEETGRISLATKGQLYIINSPCDLRQRVSQISKSNLTPG